MQGRTPTADEITGSYEHLTELTESLSGPDLHSGYWLDETDRSSNEQATARLTDMLIDRLSTGVGDEVLDLGCGNGLPAIRLADSTGAHVTAVDINEQALQRARNRAGDSGVEPSVRFERADALDLPYPDRAFDAVLAFESTPHLTLDAAFAQIGRVLRPGGRLVIETPCPHEPLPDPLPADLAAYAEIFQIHAGETVAEHQRILHAAGFRVDAVEDISEHTKYFLSRILDRLHERHAELENSCGASAVQHARDLLSSITHLSTHGSFIITAHRAFA